MNQLVKYYVENTKQIEGYTLKLCNFDKYKTEELVQIALTKIVEKDIQHDSSKGKESTLICQIIKNLSIDLYRKRNRKLKTIELIDIDESVKSHAGIDLPLIENEIKKLNEKYRPVMKLHIDGLSYTEIAEELSMDLGTVKSRIFRARQILKDRLSKLGFEIFYR